MTHDLSRRDLLKSSALAGAAAVLGSSAGLLLPARRILAAPPAAGTRQRALRVAHLTDIHVEPERHAGEGLAACLRHVRSLSDKPDLIFTGGDLVMDSFGSAEARTATQWDLFSKTFRDEWGWIGGDIPKLEHCLGNHDVWGWNKKNSHTTGSEARYGKKWAVELLGLPGRYRSFDRAGWHFVVLDSIFPEGDGYIGKLDDEQFEWLEGDLKAVKPGTPVLVVSHIPIVSACALFDSKPDKEVALHASTMHADANRIKRLFLKHPNVKLCLSGHIHQIDRVEYCGVTYICDGAVSGAWWKGVHLECHEGYGIVNLYTDGTFEHEYVQYGWQAKE